MCVCILVCSSLCCILAGCVFKSMRRVFGIFANLPQKCACHRHTHTLIESNHSPRTHSHTCKLVAFLRLKFHYENYLCLLLVENYFSQALQSGENFSPKRRQFCGQLGAIFFNRHSKLCVCVGAWQLEASALLIGWKPLGVRRDGTR